MRVRPFMRTLSFLSLLLSAACVAGPFSVDAKEPFLLKLNGRVVAVAETPEVFAGTRLVSESAGLSALGEKHRQEIALFDDRLEYTYEFQFRGPVAPWRIMLIPLGAGDEAEIVHGTYEKEPKTQTLRAADLPADMPEPAKVDFKLVRYIRVKTAAGAWSLDCWPRGAMGFVSSDAASVLTCMDVRAVPGGVELRAALRGSRASYNARMREKFIFYADGRGYRDVHPFIDMNYRFAFEKVVRLDFSGAPMPKKKQGHLPFGVQAYDKAVGYGWLSDTAALKLTRSSLGAKLVGERIESTQPGRFRIDLPPGHYYVTLNLGSADAATGPMSVSVNGEAKLTNVHLDKGRFRAEVFWVTSTQDCLELRFQGADGDAWSADALTVSSLGTLNEDFTLTRPWWRFAH